MIGDKTERTAVLRRQILDECSSAIETDRAEIDMIALSFQSSVRPERHVWIHVWVDLPGSNAESGYTIDLEDWGYDASWDNSVVSIHTDKDSVARNAARSWLRGELLNAALEYCVDATIEHK